MRERSDDELDRDVRAELYLGFIGTGAPPTTNAIATAVGAGESEVEQSLHRLAADHMIALAPGSVNVWMVHPFSAVPTPYPVETEDRRWWANCAWDALAIPTLLNVDARTETTCADCGASLTLRTRGGRLEPTETVVHFAVPPRRFWDDVGFT